MKRQEKFTDDGVRLKRCGKCQEWLTEDRFYSSANKYDGLASYCRPCSREYTRGRAKLPHVKATRTKWAKGQGRQVIKRYQSKNWPKKRAQLAVKKAVEAGEIVKPNSCSSCGKGCTPEGHHDDYANELDVRWLCRLCHRAWHRKHGEAPNGRLSTGDTK